MQPGRVALPAAELALGEAEEGLRGVRDEEVRAGVVLRQPEGEPPGAAADLQGRAAGVHPMGLEQRAEALAFLGLAGGDAVLGVVGLLGVGIGAFR